MLLTTSGRVYVWGNSTRKLGRGRLGDSTSPADRPCPTLIPSERFEKRKIVQIAAGDLHSLAVDDTGQVWGWGDNSSGQLGSEGIPAEINGRLWEAAPRLSPTLQKESVVVPIKLCVRHAISNAVVPLKVPSKILQRALSDRFVAVPRSYVGDCRPKILTCLRGCESDGELDNQRGNTRDRVGG